MWVKKRRDFGIRSLCDRGSCGGVGFVLMERIDDGDGEICGFVSFDSRDDGYERVCSEAEISRFEGT